MNINELPEIEIWFNNDPEKYILASVEDPTSGQKKLVIRSSCYKTDEHPDILKYLKREALRHEVRENLLINCLGGGMIIIDIPNRTITLFVTSLTFGSEPDRNQTVSILTRICGQYGWRVTKDDKMKRRKDGQLSKNRRRR